MASKKPKKPALTPEFAARARILHRDLLLSGTYHQRVVGNKKRKPDRRKVKLDPKE